MAEQEPNTEMHPYVNGHQPTAQEYMLTAMGHRECATYLLNMLAEDPYKISVVFTTPWKLKLADMRRIEPALYHGEVLTCISTVLRDRTRDWDRQIEALSMAQDEMDIVSLAMIEPEDIDWLWEPYIPLKKICFFEGDPGSGKTYLLLAVAAAITQGKSLPNYTGLLAPGKREGANVLYITAEDGLADTIRKRADKVGADLARLFVPRTPQAFSLANPQPLRNALIRFQPRLVILDPIQAFVGADIDINRTNEVRPLMVNLLALAIEYECAIVAIRHWTKAPGAKAKHRGQGSGDFAAAARIINAVGESPEDESLRIMAQSKTFERPGASLVFRINDEGLSWCGTSEMTADELSQMQPTKRQHQRKGAMEWLKDYLQEGPQPAASVLTAASAVGIAEKTLRRAKEHLGILASKDANQGCWYWRLPKFTPWDRRYPGQDNDDDIPF